MQDRLDDAIVEGQYVVAGRFLPPQIDERLETLRLLGREVVGLRQVLGDVEQLPHVVVERRIGIAPVVVHAPDRMEGHRLPPLVVDRTRPEHLEVLRLSPSGHVIAFVTQHAREARAVEM